MALRRLITNVILPNFERDVSRVMKKEVESVSPLLDSMMQPQAYGFVSESATTGAFHKSGLRAMQAQSQPVKKVAFPIKQVGLFC